MITRLKISGFKNLIDVDLSFDTFACFNGANGVGKSNLFDAINFLSALADKPLLEAALTVRGGNYNIKNLFNHQVKEMTLDIEMEVPESGLDDLAEPLKVGNTNKVRYSLTLAYSNSSLTIIKEELISIGKHCVPILVTENNNIIFFRKKSKKPFSYLAKSLPRTVLSSITTSISPVAMLTRREMQSWQLLQLEPSALRKPDEFTAPARLGSDGSHLAKTLYNLAMNKTTKIYTEIANCLNKLMEVDKIYEVKVECDEQRQFLILYISKNDGIFYPACVCSDSTLRLLALFLLKQMDGNRVLCIEEPENGIPHRWIKPLFFFLKNISSKEKQVIINTNIENTEIDVS